MSYGRDVPWHSWCFGNAAAHRAESTPNSDCTSASIYMKASTKLTADQEPVGIVISRGSRLEPTPTFFAYVWGPAPEVSDEPREAKVA
jgi:hypothetical protein